MREETLGPDPRNIISDAVDQDLLAEIEEEAVTPDHPLAGRQDAAPHLAVVTKHQEEKMGASGGKKHGETRRVTAAEIQTVVWKEGIRVITAHNLLGRIRTRVAMSGLGEKRNRRLQPSPRSRKGGKGKEPCQKSL